MSNQEIQEFQVPPYGWVIVNGNKPKEAVREKVYNGELVYHLTTREGAELIEKNGIDPTVKNSEFERVMDKFRPTEKHPYRHRSVFLRYNIYDFGGDYAVWIDTKKVDTSVRMAVGFDGPIVKAQRFLEENKFNKGIEEIEKHWGGCFVCDNFQQGAEILRNSTIQHAPCKEILYEGKIDKEAIKEIVYVR